MTDLTRRVLEAHEQNPDLDQDTPEKADAVWNLAKAAPTLARQVEAVEKLADRLDWEGDPDNHGGEPDYCRYATAARIRDALTEAEKEADQ